MFLKRKTRKKTPPTLIKDKGPVVFILCIPLFSFSQLGFHTGTNSQYDHCCQCCWVKRNLLSTRRSTLVLGGEYNRTLDSTLFAQLALC